MVDLLPAEMLWKNRVSWLQLFRLVVEQHRSDLPLCIIHVDRQWHVGWKSSRVCRSSLAKSRDLLVSDLMFMEQPTELKHITQWWKGKQQRLPQ